MAYGIIANSQGALVSHLDVWGGSVVGAGTGGSVCIRITVQGALLDLLAFNPHGGQGITRNGLKPNPF